MQELKDSLKYKQWTDSLEKNKIEVESISELYTIRKPSDQSILFSLVNIKAKDQRGIPLLPTAMLRGHFVAVLTVLIDKKTQEKFLLLVKQLRVANGEVFYEHPAGMCDGEADPLKVAYKEVEEETGFDVKDHKLEILNPDLLYSSPGLIDEAGYYYYAEIELDRIEIEKFKNKSAGADNESEFIDTDIATFEEAFKLIKNVHGLLHIYLYLDHKGKLTKTF